MAVSQRLELRQSQSLVMTPQLQQAIKLLQLSNLELVDFVDQELESNPLLERDESPEGASPAAAETVEPAEPAAAEAGEGLDSLDHASTGEMTAESEQPLDTSYEDDEGPGTSGEWSTPASGGARPDDAGMTIEQTVSEAPSLRQHLLLQLQVEIADPVERMIGLHLIDLLDEAGYLTGELTDVAATLGCDMALVETTLARLQGFEPSGIFARSLQECLALQLAERNRLDPAMAALLDNLHLLAEGNADRLRSLCGIDDEDLAEMVAEIRALDPKPALAFEAGAMQPVVPDILMRARPDGSWLLELNSETLPRVLVNGSYYAKVSQQARKPTERAYITEQFQSANWLVKSLHQRATTILKVSSEIVRQQDAFFHKGVQHLRPLTLRTVAEAIEMHESTVSRVTSNKFMATPRGTFELKYFFGASISATDTADAYAAESVRHRIKSLIDGESAQAILSDDALMERLRDEGIDIARRTVAKYREALRIPSSVQRRRQKQNTL